MICPVQQHADTFRHMLQAHASLFIHIPCCKALIFGSLFLDLYSLSASPKRPITDSWKQPLQRMRSRPEPLEDNLWRNLRESVSKPPCSSCRATEDLVISLSPMWGHCVLQQSICQSFPICSVQCYDLCHYAVTACEFAVRGVPCIGLGSC